MKNYIPIILAVLLGLAAVLAVSRMIALNKQAPEDEAWVVVAQRDLNENDVLQADSVQKKVIPTSARPAEAIVWSKRSLIVGQTLKRRVQAGDYILMADINLMRSMSALVGEGEWAVTINVANASMAQPGDEVAVIATFPVELAVATADLSQAPQKNSKEVTLVLFPRVRVLENGGSGKRDETGAEIVLALPPQQAQVLIAAQGKARLTLALRRPGDSSALSRSSAGLVDETTFQQLLKAVPAVNIPDAPGAKAR
ncbi:MAG: Flp pilus assembly protein CpaB [Verrucomicrobiota bacterium]|jgi:Flp pilus assembly protein CpaB